MQQQISSFPRQAGSDVSNEGSGPSPRIVIVGAGALASPLVNALKHHSTTVEVVTVDELEKMTSVPLRLASSAELFKNAAARADTSAERLARQMSVQGTATGRISSRARVRSNTPKR